MARLEAAKCGCEYPCSCFKYKGKEYGGTHELIDELEAEVQRLQGRVTSALMGRRSGYDERKFN